MTETFQCGDNAALVGYLYDECEPHARTAIAAHVTVCAACAAELAALRSTRVQLAAWSPPEAELGFLITQRQTAQPVEFKRESKSQRVHWFARPLPAWAQVAAATVVFAVGMLLGIATRAGAPPQMRAAAVTQPGSGAGVSDAALAALESRLRNEIASIRTANQAPVTTAAASSSSSGSEAQLMTRVRALIEESEQRQQRELALRTADLVRDFDSQRRVDLAQIQRNFGQIEGLTGAEVREQREMLNYLMRVSQQQR